MNTTTQDGEDCEVVQNTQDLFNIILWLVNFSCTSCIYFQNKVSLVTYTNNTHNKNMVLPNLQNLQNLFTHIFVASKLETFFKNIEVI